MPDARSSSAELLLVMASFPDALQLRQVLVSFGLDVAGVVGNTRDAIRFAGKHKPALAVIDTALPDGERGQAAAATLFDTCGIQSILLCPPDDPAFETGGAGLRGVVGVLPGTGQLHDTARAIGMILQTPAQHERHTRTRHAQGDAMIFDLYCFITDFGADETPDLRDKVREAASRFESALKDLTVSFSLELRDARSNQVVLTSVYTGAAD